MSLIVNMFFVGTRFANANRGVYSIVIEHKEVRYEIRIRNYQAV